ncbi:hypothetical protein [Burkholderia metallica]
MNAFTESMALERGQFRVRAHLVMRGRAPETRFAENGRPHMQRHEARTALVQSVMAGLSEPGPITHSQDGAEAMRRAATNAASPLRIPAGADAMNWAVAKCPLTRRAIKLVTPPTSVD